VQTPATSTTPTTPTKPPPSILKSLALAVGTLTLSTWALGTLWMQTEGPQPTHTPAGQHVNPPANPSVVASNAR
jgi:hypothetical protein